MRAGRSGRDRVGSCWAQLGWDPLVMPSELLPPQSRGKVPRAAEAPGRAVDRSYKRLLRNPCILHSTRPCRQWMPTHSNLLFLLQSNHSNFSPLITETLRTFHQIRKFATLRDSPKATHPVSIRIRIPTRFCQPLEFKRLNIYTVYSFADGKGISGKHR